MRACYSRTMLREVSATRKPTRVLSRISMQVNRIGEYPARNCHVLMHTVGRRYAALRHVTLATLTGYLPQSNDAACAAGFAHGMITAIAPQTLRAGPAATEAICDQAMTRYLRYSCTHGIGHASRCGCCRTSDLTQDVPSVDRLDGGGEQLGPPPGDLLAG